LNVPVLAQKPHFPALPISHCEIDRRFERTGAGPETVFLGAENFALRNWSAVFSTLAAPKPDF
jgi:hypothetical protein